MNAVGVSNPSMPATAAALTTIAFACCCMLETSAMRWERITVSCSLSFTWSASRALVACFSARHSTTQHSTTDRQRLGQQVQRAAAGALWGHPLRVWL